MPHNEKANLLASIDDDSVLSSSKFSFSFSFIFFIIKDDNKIEKERAAPWVEDGLFPSLSKEEEDHEEEILFASANNRGNRKLGTELIILRLIFLYFLGRASLAGASALEVVLAALGVKNSAGRAQLIALVFN